MPVGSTIAAARGGTVKYVREDSTVCGAVPPLATRQLRGH